MLYQTYRLGTDGKLVQRQKEILEWIFSAKELLEHQNGIAMECIRLRVG